MRPHQYYKQIFRQEVVSFEPTSLLDVGCGEGAWVMNLRQQGIDAFGLDTRVQGDEPEEWIVQGTAGDLPFDDKSIDVVTSEFSAHHFADLQTHLKEACRVARKAVAILDPWYDDSIPSQRVARRLDEWFKRIDRSCGEVHHDVIAAGDFLRAIPEEVAVRASAQHILQLEEVPMDKYSEWFDTYRAKCGEDSLCMDELGRIQQEISVDGLSQDGAIIFIADLRPQER